MVADVGYLCRMITHSESTSLITRDLLGIGSQKDSSQELDLDLQVPSGYEKRLDLKSGKVYLERCKSSNAWEEKQKISKFKNLNQPSCSGKPLKLFDDINLDLKLVSLSSTSSYQSVCTLGKVKFAVESVEKENNKKRSISMSTSATLDDESC
ncbi:hypothetical protein L2E82_38266 [Cichorium intybus]|uniref:Uncharacterized protein n=1 Tax=Cichorium intybus TaxID=13427 RepID=A0ACB9AF26_CICIN|nr:hypothetical protein L2E82_38266 [Cichorium intybus]